MRPIEKKEKLIEKEDDLVDKALLTKSSLDQILKSKLSTRALKAEEDIKAGRVYTREELDDRLRLGG